MVWVVWVREIRYGALLGSNARHCFDSPRFAAPPAPPSRPPLSSVFPAPHLPYSLVFYPLPFSSPPPRRLSPPLVGYPR